MISIKNMAPSVVSSAKEVLLKHLSSLLPQSLIDLKHQSESAPSAQNAIDIFKGEWVSVLPPPLNHLKAGTARQFADEKMIWGLRHLGSLEEKTVLELGPLEGGRTHLIAKSGAKLITAVESNPRAFLRCLLVKELIHLNQATFSFGNYVAYLKACEQKFDVCVAFGVLEHTKNPVEFLELMAQAADRLCLWTRYYDPSMKQDARFAHFNHDGTRSYWNGFRHRLYR